MAGWLDGSCFWFLLTATRNGDKCKRAIIRLTVREGAAIYGMPIGARDGSNITLRISMNIFYIISYINWLLNCLDL